MMPRTVTLIAAFATWLLLIVYVRDFNLSHEHSSTWLLRRLASELDAAAGCCCGAGNVNTGYRTGGHPLCAQVGYAMFAEEHSKAVGLPRIEIADNGGRVRASWWTPTIPTWFDRWCFVGHGVEMLRTLRERSRKVLR